MSGDIALDTSGAICFLNGDEATIQKVQAQPRVFLPTVVVGEMVFGAENSNRAAQDLLLCLAFVETCEIEPIGKATAMLYSQTRLDLKKKGRPISVNDFWIAAQCLEYGWTLATRDSDFSSVVGLSVEHW